jgi:hypothetical protein
VLRKAINDIKLLALGLGPNQTYAGNLCPFCQGGRDKERCFSITRSADGAILYLCHRASCNKKGKITDHPTFVQTNKSKAVEPFTKETKFLTDLQIQFFEAKYGITGKELAYAGFLYAPTEGKFVQPVYGPGRAYRGVVLRDYNVKDVKSHRNVLHEPWQGWYFNPNPRGIVIVEDQLSALKAARFYTTVALLNTTFTQDKALEIKRVQDSQNIKTVLLSLDFDARETAMGLVKRWGSFIEGLCMELTTNNKDLKYWSDEKLRELIA